MKFIQANFTVMDLATAVDQMVKRTLPKNAIVITFDDGYKDNLYNAAEILAGLNMVATFFIATGYLNSGRMWNDTIIDAIRQTAKLSINLRGLGLGIYDLSDNVLKLKAARSIIQSVKYLESSKRLNLVSTLSADLEVELEDDYMLTDEEVVKLDGIGMEIGAHTVTHPILLAESKERVALELVKSKRYLEVLLDKEISSFAYPNGQYGKDYDETTARLVAEAGFKCAVTTEPGVSSPGDDLYQIRRFTPWSKNVFKYSLQLVRNAYF